MVPGDLVGNAASFDLQADGFARASLVEIPPGRTELRPEWIYFVRVADVAASVAKAVELGGRVVAAPRAVPSITTVAPVSTSPVSPS